MKLTEAARIREKCQTHKESLCPSSCLLFETGICNLFYDAERLIHGMPQSAPSYERDKPEILKALRAIDHVLKFHLKAAGPGWDNTLAALEGKESKGE